MADRNWSQAGKQAPIDGNELAIGPGLRKFQRRVSWPFGLPSSQTAS